MIVAILYAIGGFIELLIAGRFFLRLAGANPDSQFVAWVYDWSRPFVAPFAGIFGSQTSVTGPGAVTSSVFDWTALIALVVIGIIVGLIGTLLGRRA